MKNTRDVLLLILLLLVVHVHHVHYVYNIHYIYNFHNIYNIHSTSTSITCYIHLITLINTPCVFDTQGRGAKSGSIDKISSLLLLLIFLLRRCRRLRYLFAIAIDERPDSEYPRIQALGPRITTNP
ncbi:hypothetical protein ASPBRDRAFT_193128 [Aspergillus brasiliensis CBS 101740]|uniref:Uncharacterized protein n=1 Tax=Aspergillus brasiliensis (strain CBS 101740 / IMI 381727 / IBT 21946) TaxID=767769 RepID=A0A1L9URP4_ASPBC|nr:hypothetical protein ASPBRDRAFT_193128 [Aspergillus brasiliensis CBS 101740]